MVELQERCAVPAEAGAARLKIEWRAPAKAGARPFRGDSHPRGLRRLAIVPPRATVLERRRYVAGIEDLDYHAALGRLFDGIEVDGRPVTGETVTPPAGWPGPQCPPADTALDKLIFEMLTTSKGQKIKLDPAKADAVCPYYGARQAVARAVAVARDEAGRPDRRKQRRQDLRTIEADVHNLRKGIARFLDRYDSGSGIDWLRIIAEPVSELDARRDDRAVNAELAALDLIRKDILRSAADLAAALSTAQDRASAARKRLSGDRSPGEPWRRGFVRSLARDWLWWTERLPSKTVQAAYVAPFVKFAQAAYQALGFKPPPATKLESSIKSALADFDARPEWDRPEPQYRREDPPGTQEITSADALARREKAIESDRREPARGMKMLADRHAAEHPSSAHGEDDDGPLPRFN